LQHAYKLDWSVEQLPHLIIDEKTEPLPAEKSWERRKRLYKMAISCFDQSRLYERSIELYSELVDQHRKRMDFTLLNEVLQEEAKEYDQLDDASYPFDIRSLPPFFLIIYSGLGFPVSVANRRFVQRADTNDTVETVAARMKRKFPDAETRTIDSIGTINLDSLADENKVVIIIPLRPSNQQDIDGFDNLFPPKMPAATREYQLFNNTRIFTEAKWNKAKLIPEGGKKEEEEEKNGTEAKEGEAKGKQEQDEFRYFFETEEPFPANRRTVAVERIITKKQSPLTCEVSLLSSRLNELELKLIAFCHAEKPTADVIKIFSEWAVNAFIQLKDHVKEIAIPEFITRKFTGDDIKLQERIRVILARFCSVVREIVIANSKQAVDPPVQASICDLAAEIIQSITKALTPPAKSAQPPAKFVKPAVSSSAPPKK